MFDDNEESNNSNTIKVEGKNEVISVISKKKKKSKQNETHLFQHNCVLYVRVSITTMCHT